MVDQAGYRLALAGARSSVFLYLLDKLQNRLFLSRRFA